MKFKINTILLILQITKRLVLDFLGHIQAFNTNMSNTGRKNKIVKLYTYI